MNFINKFQTAYIIFSFNPFRVLFQYIIYSHFNKKNIYSISDLHSSSFLPVQWAAQLRGGKKNVLRLRIQGAVPSLY